jgi:hypothetical protein
MMKNDSITNSHFITKTLLRRFTSNKQLEVHHKDYNNVSYRNPEQISYIQFPSEIINKHEAIWSQIERRMAGIFHMLDNGQILENETNKNVIKEFIALHFVRSMHVIALIGRNEPKYFQQILDNIKLENPEIENELNESIPSQREHFAYLLKYKFLPTFFESNFNRVMEYVLDQDIEIAEVLGKYELILSDSPIINLDDQNNQSILEGVALLKSTTLIMPLGPRHIVALKSKNAQKEYIPLLTNSVNKINSFSVKQSVNYFYCNPTTSKYRIGY